MCQTCSNAIDSVLTCKHKCQRLSDTYVLETTFLEQGQEQLPERTFSVTGKKCLVSKQQGWHLQSFHTEIVTQQLLIATQWHIQHECEQYSVILHLGLYWTVYAKRKCFRTMSSPQGVHNLMKQNYKYFFAWKLKEEVV